MLAGASIIAYTWPPGGKSIVDALGRCNSKLEGMMLLLWMLLLELHQGPASMPAVTQIASKLP